MKKNVFCDKTKIQWYYYWFLTNYQQFSDKTFMWTMCVQILIINNILFLIYYLLYSLNLFKLLFTKDDSFDAQHSIYIIYLFHDIENYYCLLIFIIFIICYSGIGGWCLKSRVNSEFLKIIKLFIFLWTLIISVNIFIIFVNNHKVTKRNVCILYYAYILFFVFLLRHHSKNHRSTLFHNTFGHYIY